MYIVYLDLFSIRKNDRIKREGMRYLNKILML